MATLAPLAVPLVPWSKVAARIDRYWNPFERNPHQAVFGTTGAGKTFLIRHGILPLRPLARTVVIDVKADRDRAWQGWGRTVDELPRTFGGDGTGPAGMQYRLVVNRSRAKEQVRAALEQIRGEGHAVVVLDESRSVTEREQMNLGSLVENLILESRGLGVTLILGAQSTSWAVSALKDQPSVLWVGRMRNGKQARALAEMAGYGRELDPVIRSVPSRSWLYSDQWSDTPALALTRLATI